MGVLSGAQKQEVSDLAQGFPEANQNLIFLLWKRESENTGCGLEESQNFPGRWAQLRTVTDAVHPSSREVLKVSSCLQAASKIILSC